MAERRDLAYSEFLRTCVPRLGLRWFGFKRVQSTVRKRLSRRVAELGLRDIEQYARYLEAEPAEWARLDAICRIPISRFYRDSAVFEYLAQTVLRERAEQAKEQHRKSVRVWSAGCASGEEPYSIAIAWRLEVQAIYPALELEVLATDLDPGMLDRARRGCYPAGTVRELPERWRMDAFTSEGALYCLRAPFRQGVRFECADVRSDVATGPFDVVLCRNLAFTYFDEPSQARVARSLLGELRPGGAFVVGAREVLPPDTPGVQARHRGIYEKLPRVEGDPDEASDEGGEERSTGRTASG